MAKDQLQKKDFIEIEFTGRIKDGEIFDSNIKENLEKLHAGHDHAVETKPFIFCLGEGMFVKGVDEFLVGKELGEYKISLEPEDAFGKRDPKAIKMVPLKSFTDNNLNPIPGSAFNFDGRIARVLTVSSGRVIIDFNNPIAGKKVEYDVKVTRKVTDQKEKINALSDFFFRQEFPFELKENKLTLKVPKGAKQFAEAFKEKYKDLLGLDLEAEEVEPEKPKEEPKEEEKKEKDKESKEDAKDLKKEAPKEKEENSEENNSDKKE